MPRAKQRTPELRDHVLEVAIATLAAEGVTGFTTRTVAAAAETSTNAVYELFGDKRGLIRAVFFEGFRRLRAQVEVLPESDDARADLVDALGAVRRFVRASPELAEVMFSQPFASFDPGPDEIEAGDAVRSFVVARVRRAIEARAIAGHETDIAHILLALVQGLAAQEAAGWLGTSRGSINRRWKLAFDAVLDGLAPGAGAGLATRGPDGRVRASERRRVSGGAAGRERVPGSAR